MVLAAACQPESRPSVAVAMGASELTGALLAMESLAPGLPFDTMFRFSPDSRAAPAIAVAQEIVARPGMVAVIGHANSGASLATAPIYNQSEIVQLTPNATATAYSLAGPFSFRLAPPDAQQARFLADVLVARFSGQSAALLYENDEYGRELRRELVKAVPEGTIRWVADTPHLQGQDSVLADQLAHAVVLARPDVIVWLGRELTARAWFPRLRAGLGPVPIVGSDALSPIVMHRSPDVSIENTWWVDLVDPDATPALQSFAAAFRARFGHDPIGSQVLTYDAVLLIAAAVRDGARTGDDVRTWLVSLGRTRPRFQGLSGEIAFDANGDVARRHVMCTFRERVRCQ
jgi:branched-chain amino acid transport system substrate-binding protein